MHHALFVSGGQRVGDGDRQLQHAGERQPARRDEIREALALDQLHGEKADVVVVLDREQRDDVGVVEAGHRARLALESGQAVGVRRHVGRQYLERHLAAEAHVPGPIHLAHAARAERGDDFVSPQAGAGDQCHVENLPQAGAVWDDPRSWLCVTP
jgi:hypothetical protein